MTKPRFQLHLSTAIVLMFVSSAFAALNFRIYPILGLIKFAPRNVATCCGWPATLFMHQYKKILDFGEEVRIISEFNSNGKPWSDGELQISGLLFNALTLIALICLTTSICNWLIRRRQIPA